MYISGQTKRLSYPSIRFMIRFETFISMQNRNGLNKREQLAEEDNYQRAEESFDF